MGLGSFTDPARCWQVIKGDQACGSIQWSFDSQALANYEELLLGRLQTLFSPRTGALGLGLVAICTCEGYSDLWAGHGPGGFIRLREVLLSIVVFTCYRNVILTGDLPILEKVAVR